MRAPWGKARPPVKNEDDSRVTLIAKKQRAGGFATGDGGEEERRTRELEVENSIRALRENLASCFQLSNGVPEALTDVIRYLEAHAVYIITDDHLKRFIVDSFAECFGLYHVVQASYISDSSYGLDRGLILHFLAVSSSVGIFDMRNEPLIYLLDSITAPFVTGCPQPEDDVVHAGCFIANVLRRQEYYGAVAANIYRRWSFVVSFLYETSRGSSYGILIMRELTRIGVPPEFERDFLCAVLSFSTPDLAEEMLTLLGYAIRRNPQTAITVYEHGWALRFISQVRHETDLEAMIPFLLGFLDTVLMGTRGLQGEKGMMIVDAILGSYIPIIPWEWLYGLLRDDKLPIWKAVLGFILTHFRIPQVADTAFHTFGGPYAFIHYLFTCTEVVNYRLKYRIVGGIYAILDGYLEGDEQRNLSRQLRLDREFVQWFGELFVAPPEDWKQYDYVQMRLFGMLFCQCDELGEDELESVRYLISSATGPRIADILSEMCGEGGCECEIGQESRGEAEHRIAFVRRLWSRFSSRLFIWFPADHPQ
jgi:hypothetical protein